MVLLDKEALPNLQVAQAEQVLGLVYSVLKQQDLRKDCSNVIT